MATILVTGGTGNLGSLVTERLRQRGHDMRVLSRHAQPYAVDLREVRNGREGREGSESQEVPQHPDGHVPAGAPAGLDAALSGVEVVVHCAGGPRGDEQAGRNLVAAMRRAGVRHVVFISVVGADRVPLAYYRAKVAVEHMIEDSGIGWTILRATQFHDLIVSVLQAAARPPVILLPAGIRVQPVEVSEVADRMAELADAPPAGRVADMGGPQVLGAAELAHAYLRATGRRRRVLSVPMLGRGYQAMRHGGNLAPQQAVGRVTFDQYLAKRFGGRGAEA